MKFVVLIVVLAGLLSTVLIDTELFVLVVSLLLVLLPLADAVVAVLLRLASRRAPEVVSLRSRADDAAVLFVAASLGALVGLNRLADLDYPAPFVLVLLAFALILMSVPALDWIIVWREVALEAVRDIMGRVRGKEKEEEKP